MIKIKETDNGFKTKVKGTQSQLATQLEILITDLLDETTIDESLFYTIAQNAIDKHRSHSSVRRIIDELREEGKHEHT